ncbi:pyruvate dehydrogenase (acetyl-transferring) E1 component subunit alpha [Lentibacillus salinarum]|uniref:Pyruvate dehydrogenase E1 component subunit alpha n=1 Tax=Lentibacillus salinarum TaxID=446820 RepID=A0ABW3ZRQ7_9BACI
MTDNNYEIVRVMDDNGDLIEGVSLDMTDEELCEMYEKMLFSRIFDERAIRLQRQGRIGTYPPFKGQEAAQVGAAFNLQSGDWLFPYGRDLAACFTFGKDLKSALLYTMGHKNGSSDSKNIFPLAIMIPPQVPQAVGAAWASKLRGEDRVALATLGDGGTSKGDFHEGLNMAAVYKAPAIFLCQNNQWAISVPIDKQTASETIAQKAVAYGMEGVRVDGNDVLAVHKVTKEATIRARNGEGPTLIEALTYRIGPHTTSDDPTRYREESETEKWQKRDPIELYKQFLVKRGLWSEQKDGEAKEKMKEIINEAVREAETEQKTTLADIFEHVYETQSDDLIKAQQEVKEDFTLTN